MGAWEGPAVWPPRPTLDQLTTAGLFSNGNEVRGWVRVPKDKLWNPDDGDLLWLPPSATKSTDVDRAGQLVEVTFDPTGDLAWVRAQLNKRERYLDTLRDRVRAGQIRLTAALAKFLGLDFGDGAEMVPRTGPLAYGKSAPALPTVRHHKSWCSAGHSLDIRCEVNIGG